MSRTVKARRGPRRVGVTQARRELYATARLVDSSAAQVIMLAEDDFVSDATSDELEDLGRRLRRVAEALFDEVDRL